MKCVCGYEKGYDHENEEDIGDEEFDKLNVIFLTPEHQRLYRYEYNSKPNALYMCPRYGTVRAERD